MKAWITVVMMCGVALCGYAEHMDDQIGSAVQSYFDDAFVRLGAVAEQNPDVDSFREAMKPCAEATDGFFGGTYIDTNYVIRQTFYKKNFLAKGFSLRKVSQLDWFWDQMDQNPAPQLSEPARGNIMQPRLIAMRYPVFEDGKLSGVVSMMIRTEAFLKAVGLDACNAYEIICRGELAEKEGELKEPYQEVELELPSNRWTIRYNK